VEAAFWAGIARNVATTAETKDTGAVPVAGGYAVAVQGSDLAIALGIGTRRPLRADDLETIRSFFVQRGLPARIEIAGDVYERDAAILGDAGYTIEAQLAVWVRDPIAPLSPPELPPVTGLKRGVWVAAFGGALEAQAAAALSAVRDTRGLIAGAAVAVSGDTALVLRWSGPAHGAWAESALVAGLAMAQTRGATRALLKLPAASELAPIALAAGFTPAEQRYRLATKPAASGN
jgi:hypothetical protein